MPDLVGAVDLGLRQDVARLVKENLRILMITILANEVTHAEAVAAGPFRFRTAFGRDMGPFFANSRAECDHLAEGIYQFFAVKWRTAHPGLSAGQFLDAYAPVSPPTQEEIDAAWEVEIASSAKAMRTFYEGEARTRKGADVGARRRPREEDDE